MGGAFGGAVGAAYLLVPLFGAEPGSGRMSANIGPSKEGADREVASG